MINEPINLPTLTQLIITNELDGSSGTNRYDKTQCQIRADNDKQAIDCWLNEYRHSAATFRTYQKEAERFLLWCVYQLKKPFSSIVREDIEAYNKFLENPEPKEIWCARAGGHYNLRGTSNWRPFTGKLNPSAKASALSALGSLFDYLVQAKYLHFNPLALIRKRHAEQKSHSAASLFKLQERILETDEWHAMLNVIEHWPANSDKAQKEKARLQFLVKILYFLGLRIEELTSHNWGAFRKVENQWWFFVLGKGNKLGKIPVNDELLKAIIQYRSFLNKPPLPLPNEETPLIHSVKTQERISPRQINHILKKLALETSKKFKDKPEIEKKLQKFSAHWLRHLSASMQDKAGVAFKHIRGNLRHENDETTRRYVHAYDDDRYQDMQKLTLKI